MQKMGWEKLREKLKNPKGKKFPHQMDLTELLEAERKFLAWYPTTTHPEKETKKHIYKNHIKPRIKQLQIELEEDKELQQHAAAVFAS